MTHQGQTGPDGVNDANPKMPDGTPSWVTPELLSQTLDAWQAYYSYRLTPEDAIEIILNTERLFELLM